jgi:hypothetical protein
MDAVPLTVASLVLVAVTVIRCVPVMLVGAVYSPRAGSIAPTCGLMLQVTPGASPAAVAANCWLCPLVSVTADGVMVTDGGASVTLAVPVASGSNALVAITETFCVPTILEGAA